MTLDELIDAALAQQATLAQSTATASERRTAQKRDFFLRHIQRDFPRVVSSLLSIDDLRWIIEDAPNMAPQISFMYLGRQFELSYGHSLTGHEEWHMGSGPSPWTNADPDEAELKLLWILGAWRQRQNDPIS